MRLTTEIEKTAAIRFGWDVLMAELDKVFMESAAGAEKSDETADETKLSTVALRYDREIPSQGYRCGYTQAQITLFVSDEAGAMYGLLDLAEHQRLYGTLAGMAGAETAPLVLNRGIKFNIPLDARTPSYSDSGDSAVQNIGHMWEYDFWTEFLDLMAKNKYNVLSLWSMSPFPSMVQIPEYPLTALADVKRTTRPFHAQLSGWDIYAPDLAQSLITVKRLSITEKIAFWQSVMEYAKARCIKIYLFTWNVFTYGTEESPYGITASQDNPVTADYFYCAVKAVMRTYPLLAGIGITSGEHMAGNDSDIEFLANTYGRAVREVMAETPEREFRLVHRMQMARYEAIMAAFQDFPCPFEISFKYSQAHMYANSRPHFIDEFLERKDEQVKIWLTVRNDDYYLYRWGDPEFAREYLEGMPHDTLAGFYMGADGFTWGRDYLDIRDSRHRLFLDKMWYMAKIWGELSYCPQRSRKYFEDVLRERFALADGAGIYDTWREASAIIAKVNCVHWQDYDFQWYPEGCCHYDYQTDKLVFSDINEFIGCPSVPGERIYSIEEYCQDVLEGRPKKDWLSPLTMSCEIREHARNTIKQVNDIYGLTNISKSENGWHELRDTLEDLTALAALGCYYADKIEAAVKLRLFRLTGEASCRLEAVALLSAAARHWHSYASRSKAMYRPQRLNRLMGKIDMEEHNEMTLLDVLLAREG